MFGEADNGLEGYRTAACLRGLGAQVDRVARGADDLWAYGVIWHVACCEAMGEYEPELLGDLSRTSIVDSIQNFPAGRDGCEDPRHGDGLGWLGPSPPLSPSELFDADRPRADRRADRVSRRLPRLVRTARANVLSLQEDFSWNHSHGRGALNT